MLSTADLETNILEFRQRAFQYARTATVDGAPFAVFGRTETESESRFRPALVHLVVVVPLAWVVYDEAADALRIARDGRTPPPALTEPVVEVGAEPTEFSEQGVRWRRSSGPAGAWLYVPEELGPGWLSPPVAAAVTGT